MLITKCQMRFFIAKGARRETHWWLTTWCRHYNMWAGMHTRKTTKTSFAQYQGPIDLEIRDLHITTGNDVAFIFAVERVGGTLKNRQKSEVWVRATECYRKINGHWLAVHDHISVPADMETGKAALDLKP